MDRTLPQIRQNRVSAEAAKATIAKAKINPAPLKKRGAQALETHQSKNVRQYLSATSAKNAALIDPDKPLTEKQRLFVQYWAQGDSIQSASRRAGYNDGAAIAYRMVKMPNILKLKAEYEAKWEATGAMTRQKVMDGMLEAIEMARMMAEPSSMIAGWREIGKICGYYAPVEHRVKVDVSGNVIVDRLNSLSDAELLKIIQGGAQAALPGT